MVTNFSDTVSSIKLTVNNPNNGLAILNWNKIFSPTNSPTASNWYKIYQEYPLGTWTLIDSVQYGNEYYRDTITICDDTVNYRVTNTNTNCTSISSVDGSNFKDVLPPKPPVIKNVSVDTSNNQATISWHKGYPLDTRAYIILKFIGSSWIPIDTVYGIDNTSYTYATSIAGNESECYGVAAFDSCWYGIPLTPNTSAMGISHCSIYLEATHDVCNKTIDLTWNPYTTWSSGINSYQIYYSINQGIPILLSTTSSTSIQLSNVSSDSTYCFVIKAISGDLNDTANSNKECIVTTYPFISDTNYIQTTTVVNQQQTQLRIFTPSYNTIKGYNIERSTNGTTYQYIGYIPNISSPIVYNDYSVNTELTTYYYKALAIDSCQNITNKKSNYARTILLNSNITSGNYEVELNWNTYKAWNGNVKEYNVYRILGNNPAVLIGTVTSTDSTFKDDISSFYASSDDGQFCYSIQAVENTNQFGFFETSESNISCVSPSQLIYVPNAFTPNRDGINDVFQPVIGFANYNTYSLQIFNRLGQLIFETNNINNPWDGTHKGKVIQNDILLYTIKIENAQGKPISKSGTIAIMR